MMYIVYDLGSHETVSEPLPRQQAETFAHMRSIREGGAFQCLPLNDKRVDLERAQKLLIKADLARESLKRSIGL